MNNAMNKMKNRSGRLSGFKVAALALACSMASAAWANTDAGENEQRNQEASASASESSSGASDGALDELVRQEKELTTFAEAVQQAGLVEALESGTYTIFAPTDDAFESADQNVEDLMKPENRQQLVELLRAHIVADDVDPQMAAEIGRAATLDGGTVELSGEGENLQVGGASVVKSDIQQGNLRVYAIDQVLTPSAGESMAAGVDFESLDQDGDGYLTESELEGQETLASQQSELDEDGDERISRTEFAAFEQQQSESAGDSSSEEEKDSGGWFGGGDDDEESESN